jgi:hypothetical protein
VRYGRQEGYVLASLLSGSPPSEPGGPKPPSGNCDPSYPDFCIPPPPPDLDCKDIDGGNFTVRPPDPHGFDGNDNDGIGCEGNTATRRSDEPPTEPAAAFGPAAPRWAQDDSLHEGL